MSPGMTWPSLCLATAPHPHPWSSDPGLSQVALPGLLGSVWVCLALFELSHGCGGLLGHDGASRRVENLGGELDRNRKSPNLDTEALALSIQGRKLRSSAGKGLMASEGLHVPQGRVQRPLVIPIDSV